MKRSKKIQLLLVTAVLASCNRVIIPGQTAAAYAPNAGKFASDSALSAAPYNPYPGMPNYDPALTATPAYNDEWYNCTCLFFDNAYSNYSYTHLPHRPGHTYRRQAFWQNHQFILKGGFGRGAASTGS